MPEEQYIIFFNPGTYKITLNINFSGINNLTLNGYIYVKNNLQEVKEIIPANNEIVFNKTLNNTLQHIFPVTITHSNSKIWLRINWNNQNDIVTIKSQKTWILIEQLY
nr:collagen [Mimivirus sp.]